MKRLLIVIVLVVLVFGCKKTGNGIEPVVNPKIVSVESAGDFMQFISGSVEEKKKGYEEQMLERSYLLKNHRYHNQPTLVFKLNALGNDELISGLKNKKNPARSYDGAFYASVNETKESRPGSVFDVSYKIEIIHKSNNSSVIFDCDDDLYQNVDVSAYFNKFSWHPYENIIVMTGNEGRENNVYLAYVVFDNEENQNFVKYRIVRLTEYNELYSLMNYNWCIDGERFTFTKFDGARYETYEYNLVEQSMKKISGAGEIVSFIYDNYRQRTGFAVFRQNDTFIPVYVDDIKNQEIKGKIILSQAGFSKPFIFGSFCLFEEKLGFYAVDKRENSMVAYYNYGEERLKSVLSKWEVAKSKGYPVQYNLPIWLYDKFMIFSAGEKLSCVDTDIDYSSKDDLVINNLVSNSGDFINSVQWASSDSIMYTYREISSFKTKKIGLKITEKTIKPPMTARMYQVEFSDVMTKDEFTGIVNMKRKGKSRSSEYGATLGVRDGKNVIEFNSQEDFDKAKRGEKLFTRWSTDVKDRKIKAEYRIPRNPGDILFQGVLIKN